MQHDGSWRTAFSATLHRLALASDKGHAVVHRYHHH
jgi:hypothetical protein